MTQKAAIIRQEHFNSAHRLHNDSWSDEVNREVFGKCNNPNYHGHNYKLEVRVVGEIDEKTGFVIDVKILKEIIKTEVLDKYDHKNLNLDVDDFKEINPTAENISRVIYNNLRKVLSKDLELSIKVHETERNIAEYPAR